MKKSVNIALGVVIVAGALITAGAWYTGIRLEGVLGDAVEQGNQQIQAALVGHEGSASVELVSLNRHFFTSTAHYKVTFQAPRFNEGQPVVLLFQDNIEHGPFPWSRVKKLDLVPVMAASNLVLEKNAFSEKWFEMTSGQSPLTGQFSMGYDRAAQGRVELLPFQFDSQNGSIKFSGFTLNATGTADGEKLEANGVLSKLDVTATSEEGPVHLLLDNVTFNTGGTKGQSGFYLGHSDAKASSMTFQAANQPAVELKDFVNTSLLQEVEGKLAAQVTYDIANIRFNGKDIGSSQMLWKFTNFDVASTKNLLQFYQDKIQPQAQAASATGQRYTPHLSPADQALVQAEMNKLLAAKPHIELEKLSLKTASGESRFTLSMDLSNPTSLDQPGSVLLKQLLTNLEAKLVLSKGSIRDLATLQAQSAGITDPAAVAQNAQGAADSVGGMAIMLQLGKVEGDNIVSNLHYADDVVDFNGEKMSAQQFAAAMMGKFVMLNRGY
ncbi:YdgA family protein [Pseudomonas sp. GD03842]|uniref:YdgA family protein n=1 Tax=Pseudomonas sp. GD03842 TaxID=2975385 RepID=UPI002448D398|nr:YdgA family protein [Pseudomonas sp. GD03842]MDH0749408.1 YdgA family protein [Pseudomonas sp. GD03842]